MSAAKSKALELFRAQRLPEARAAFEAVCAGDPTDAEAWVALGVIHGMQGDLGQAEHCCRQAVERAPESSEAHANLGVVLAARRDYPRAVESYRQALALKPGHPPTHNNLGAAFNALGQTAEAKACYERAIQLSPNYAEAHYNLGNLLLAQNQAAAARDRYLTTIKLNPNHSNAYTNLGKAQTALGQLNDAVKTYETALRLDPRQAGAHNNLGLALTELGEHERALASFKEALRVQPSYAEAYNNLGLTYAKANKLAEAVAAYREALRLDPRQAGFHNNLAIALARQERLDDAVASYQTAIALKPEYAEAHNNLGLTLHGLGRSDEAIGHYREALRLDPAYAETHTNLGIALCDRGLLEQAVEHYRTALRHDPSQIEARLNLGEALQAQGRLDEALALYRELLELKPDYVEAHSNLLLALNYQPGQTPDALFREHRRWAERHARHTPAIVAHANPRDPERRLRIGYVSPDLREHSVAYFTAPILAHHDRDRFETFCYAQVARDDAVTERLKPLAGHWRRTVGMIDAELAARVRADGIDILVDLAGHTANNRLTALASRPAPIQVTYLGYPNTTGLATMDYRLTDAWADPPGMEAYYSEQLVRLPKSFCCYQPPHESPPVNALPAESRGDITFASLNSPAKLNEEVIALWAKILAALPTSRLILQAKAFADARTCALFRERFAKHGIAGKRIEILPSMSFQEHLAVYHAVDIALDPFPWCGHTTSCHALWMGIPVITLPGDRHAGRMTASVLHNIGLPEYIADSPDDYITIAQRLSQDPQRLSDLRHGLRARLQASTLCDAAAFTRDLEDAYRDMWRRWCEKT